jgi:hypothetical protein
MLEIIREWTKVQEYELFLQISHPPNRNVMKIKIQENSKFQTSILFKYAMNHLYPPIEKLANCVFDRHRSHFTKNIYFNYYKFLMNLEFKYLFHCF